jgi:uncharacterized protein YoxC
MSSAGLSVLNINSSTYWRHTEDVGLVYKALYDAVKLFESQNYLMSDVLIKFCSIRTIETQVNNLNQSTKNHINASFDLYLNKILSDEAVCLSYFLNIINRRKL